MSYRPAQPYPRRPSSDERQGSDPRDRRPDGYSRQVSDFYKDDRRRRDTDLSVRTRHPPESSARKLSVSGNHTRPEPSRTSSSSRSPTTSDEVDTGGGLEIFVTLLQRHDAAVVQLARLKAERDPLDNVLKQRQAEYEKSMVKHAEFPSVPEAQNMHRVKYAELVQALNVQIQKAQEEVDSTAHSIAQTISSLISTQDKKPGHRADVATTSLQRCEASKKQQTEISELKATLRKNEVQHIQEQTSLKDEFAAQFSELKNENKQALEEMKKNRKEMMDEIKNLRAMNEGMKKEMEAQVSQLRKEDEKRYAEQHQAQQNELQSRLLKHEEETREAVEEQLRTGRNNVPDPISRAEVSTLVQRATSALQSDVSGLSEQVGNLAEQLKQKVEDSASLRANLDACTKKIETQAERITEHDEQLAGVGSGDLGGVAEMIFGFPALERKVEGLHKKVGSILPDIEGMQKKVDDILPDIDTKNSGLVGQVKGLVTKMSNALGQMVDEVRAAVAGQEKRIKALEDASSSRGRPGTTQDLAANGSSGPDIASIRSDADVSKATVKRLEEFNGELHSLRHQVAVLDSQFSNLSTRELAGIIIANLDQVWKPPNARQLVADLQALNSQVNSMAPRIQFLEGRMPDCRGHADGFDGKSDGSASSVAGRFNSRERDEFWGNGSAGGHKRRRIDMELMGEQHLMANGTG